jgi:DNA-binding NtrC family response regulator
MKKQSLRVLVADDDHPYCVLLKKTLSTCGHSVVISNSGEEALSQLQKEPFDVVLLDFKMEGTNGINVLQWMYGKKIDIPVVLITNYGTDEVFEEAYKWGAKEHFIKGESDMSRLPAIILRVYEQVNYERQHRFNRYQ